MSQRPLVQEYSLESGKTIMVLRTSTLPDERNRDLVGRLTESTIVNREGVCT
jgi:hypothetical protein